jgi:hypothetical protein
VDAAWKATPNRHPSKAGIGIYMTCKQGLHHMDVFIQATATQIYSPIQAEAEGFLLSANIAASLLLQDPMFSLTALVL